MYVYNSIPPNLKLELEMVKDSYRKSSIVSSSSLLRGVFCVCANCDPDPDPVVRPLAPEGRVGVCGLDRMVPAPALALAPTLRAGELLADTLVPPGRLIFNMIR